jgi:hypothetical protein
MTEFSRRFTDKIKFDVRDFITYTKKVRYYIINIKQIYDGNTNYTFRFTAQQVEQLYTM